MSCIKSVWNMCLFACVSTSIPAAAQTLSMAEVARHNSKGDCWIVVENKVYDITNYIEDHPTPERVLTEYCGKDATAGWNNKGKAKRPHSKRAAVALEKLFKGNLESGK